MKKLKYTTIKEKAFFIVFSVLIIGLLVETFIFQLVWIRLGLLVSLIFAVLFLVNSFLNRLLLITKYADAAYRDELPQTRQDMLNEPAMQKIRFMHLKIQEIADFVGNIGTNSFEFNHIHSESNIADRLKELAENQASYLEDERRRSWKNEGLAKFGELLRMDDKDIKEISFVILSNLIKYLSANQGSFFIEQQEEEESRFMTLTACYAYDRRKHPKVKIYEGDGLIGQVMLEKSMLFITDIPQDYLSITSGLGKANPKMILIIPLITNDTFYGAIEIASFEIFEDYQIEFIEAVAENIAATIAKVKTNQHTHELLEQSQSMAEVLQSREDDMRKNMEELEKTQADMKKNQLELDGVFGALNNSQGLVEFDQMGEIIGANEMIEKISGYSEQDLKDRPSLLLPEINKANFWESIRNGKNQHHEINIEDKNGSSIWLSVNYSGVFDSDGNFKKALTLLQNITARKEKEKEFEKLSLVADNTNNAVIITDKNGLVEYVNPGFTRLTKFTMEDITGKKPGHLLQGPDTDQETVNRIRKSIEDKEPIYDEILNYDKEGNQYWISIAINPVFDNQGEIDKFISVQADITDTKISALDFQNKLEAIDRSNAVIEFDMEGIILSVNDNFLEIVKFEEEELIGKHHSLLLAKEDIDSDEYKNFWATLRNGEFINQEFRRKDKHGNEIWLRGIYNPLLDIEGKPFKIVKFASDITKEKDLFLQTVKQTKELESHLETLNKTIATLEIDAHGNLLNANKVYLDISGYSLENLKDQTYDFLLTEEERNKPQNEMMWQSLMNGHFFTGQFKQKSKDGKDLWLLGTFNPVLNESGEVEIIKMFAQFNTLEKEKEINNSRILGIYNSIVPVIELNSQGLTVKANEYFYDLFAITRMELRNKQISDIFEIDFSQAHFNKIINNLQDGQVIEELISHVSNEGNIRILRAIFNPIKDKDNQLKKILLMLIDKELIVKIS